MNGDRLLDTNAAIALIGEDPALAALLDPAGETFVPAPVLGELYFGACKSARIAENLRQLAVWATGSTVLSCDAETAREYGAIRASLRAKGHPIPENDIWIAAIARQHGLTLLTRDAHFAEIDGLTAEAW